MDFKIIFFFVFLVYFLFKMTRENKKMYRHDLNENKKNEIPDKTILKLLKPFPEKTQNKQKYTVPLIDFPKSPIMPHQNKIMGVSPFNPDLVNKEWASSENMEIALLGRTATTTIDTITDYKKPVFNSEAIEIKRIDFK